MLNRPKQLAPEPEFSAYLELLEQVLTYVRMMTSKPDRVTPGQIQQIHELMDAVHNIPEYLLEYGHYFKEDMIRELKLAEFDERWKEEGPRLLRILDEATARVKKRELIGEPACCGYWPSLRADQTHTGNVRQEE